MTIHAYAVKSAKSELEPFEYETELLSPIDVEVRVQYCGVCHSDLSMIDNDWGLSTYPLVPGHEVIGEITSIGESVSAGSPVRANTAATAIVDRRICASMNSSKRSSDAMAAGANRFGVRQDLPCRFPMDLILRSQSP